MCWALGAGGLDTSEVTPQQSPICQEDRAINESLPEGAMSLFSWKPNLRSSQERAPGRNNVSTYLYLD